MCAGPTRSDTGSNVGTRRRARGAHGTVRKPAGYFCLLSRTAAAWSFFFFPKGATQVQLFSNKKAHI